MAFRVFISHSTGDMALVFELRYWLQINEMEPYVAEIYPQPGVQLSEQVLQALQISDCVIVLWTKDGARSQWVNQEVAAARQAARRIIPIVEEGITPQGVLNGIEYIPYSPSRPVEAVNRAVKVIHGLALDKTSREKTTAAVLLVLGLLAVAATSSNPQEQVAAR